MAYSNRNERILERNQDGFEWRYAYDKLLRLKTQTDPNLVVRTMTYDHAGRTQYVDFSTGREDSFNYDPNDNVQTMDRSAAGATAHLSFLYDAMDRVVEQDDANSPNSQTVRYGYDPLGRVTSITYPGNLVLANSYDALGRLTNQVDWAGCQVNYTYDLADRMLSRTYPNGVVQTNAFDTAGRITSLSFSSPSPGPSTNAAIQMALTYAYDRNGNKIGGGETGTLDWPLPSLTDEGTQFTPAGRMVARQIQNNSAVSNQTSSISYHYDSSGNMTNATGNGQSWTLTYDEDNRTTTIDWRAGTNSQHVVNQYDALGRRFSKSVNGVTTGYVLSLAGGMERVLCHLDGANNVTAWYVHGPDLCYRVDATNGLTCYHADAMANVIALTGSNATLVAQYAYTPYGRSLGSTNFSSQQVNPYLFVGSQGAMEELPGLYFMRARYYSADAGVFLSTDPVKKIGPSWTPTAYNYASQNPFTKIDPTGEFGEFILTSIIVETLKVDYDILVLGKPVTFGELGARLLGAAVAGAGEEAIAYGGAFFASAGGVGAAARFASQGLANFAGDAVTSLLQGKTDLGQVAGDALIQNAVNGLFPDAGLDISSRGLQAVTSASSAIVSGFFNGIGSDRIGSLLQTPGTGGSVSQTAKAGAKDQTPSTGAVTAGAVANSAGTGATRGAAASGTSVGTTPIAGTTYTVRPGDTLGNIGYANGTTASAIWAANPGISNPNLVYPGQVIVIGHP